MDVLLAVVGGYSMLSVVYTAEPSNARPFF
jgi:hypothetical protein